MKRRAYAALRTLNTINQDANEKNMISMKQKGLLIFVATLGVVFLSWVLKEYIYLPYDDSRDKKYFDVAYENLAFPKKIIESTELFLRHKKGAGDYLIKKIKEEKRINIKIEAIKLIGQTGCSECPEGLLIFLNNEDYYVKVNVIDSLGQLKYGELSFILRRVIEEEDDDKVIRWAAYRMACCYGDNKDVDYLKILADGKYKKDQKFKKIFELGLKERNNKSS